LLISWLQKRETFISKRGLEGVPSDSDSKKGEHPRINKDRIRTLCENTLTPDPDAYYTNIITVDLNTIIPCASGPGNVKTMTPVKELEHKNIKINKAYLVSCVNSRTSDISEAASVIDGNHIHPEVDFYIAAASKEVEDECKKAGYWDILINAGAKALIPGCGPCIGLGEGLLNENEIGISATNRNFKGRMGHPSAEVYLASPMVVAASAINGKISLPKNKNQEISNPSYSIRKNPYKDPSISINIIDGFPEELEGDIIFCHQDNLNTDGIYPGKYTYKDDITPEEQAKVAMENYDPNFVNLAKSGDILAGGFTFGSGSSREQAATALKYKGLKLVIAGSFSETYKRNAINNGFLVIESPNFITDLKKKFGNTKPTVATNLKAKINFKTSTIEAMDKTYTFGSTGEAAQEIIVAGGLENWVKTQISS